MCVHRSDNATFFNIQYHQGDNPWDGADGGGGRTVQEGRNVSEYMYKSMTRADHSRTSPRPLERLRYTNPVSRVV
jgi:hypothetical protein